MSATGAVPNRQAAVVAGAALAVLAACSGNGGNGASDGAVTGCDPVAQTGCAAGQKCDLICSGGASVFACVAENGTVGVGAACSPTSPCRGGAFCAATPTTPTPSCVQFCATTSDCMTGACQSLPASAPSCQQTITTSVCN